MLKFIRDIINKGIVNQGIRLWWVSLGLKDLRA